MDAAPLSDTTLAGACHCGALAYTTTSLPTFSGYCHCEKCQRLTGGPFVATFHFPVDSVTISATPESALHTYSPPFAPHETRYRCNICGVGVCSITTGQMRTAVWGGTLARIPVHGEDGAGRIAMWEKISPALHYNYGARSLDVRDGLSKYRGDAPDESGAPGSRSPLTGGGGDIGDTENTSQDDGESKTAGGTLRIGGACFCGEISYTFPADDVVRSAYCHCSQCQKLSGCPFIHTIHLPSPSVEFTLASPDASAERQTILASQLDPKALPSALRVYNAPLKPHKSRLRCAKCGTCIASSNSRVGTTSVWGVHLARSSNGRIANWEKVKPTAHIFYGTSVLEVSDDLGKWSGYEGTSERLGG